MLTRDELLAEVYAIDPSKVANPMEGAWIYQTPGTVVAVTMFGEARSEGDMGMAMVGSVIANREREHRYGKSFSQICLRPYAFDCFTQAALRHQVDEAVDNPDSPDGKAWNTARRLAWAILTHELPDFVGGAQLYHDTSIPTPKSWLDHGAVYTVDYGRLRFLREP